MKELRKKISALINNYYDGKLWNVDWRGDTEFEDDIRSIIDETLETIDDLLLSTERTIDGKIEDWESDYNPSFQEEMEEDSIARNNALRGEF